MYIQKNIKMEIMTRNTIVFVRHGSFIAILFLKTFIENRQNGYMYLNC